MRKTKETPKGKNLVHPTNIPLSQAELAYELKKAEEGPFISVQEGMKDFEQWLQSRENE
ncbi:MAG: hypothetical protein ACM3O8_13335 [Methylococcaceae bacterium]|nr:hypothetical protein [Prolixibacteraceae bacterium]